MSASKWMTAEAAVALIRDGDKLAVSGNMDMSPMALIRALLRAGIGELELICAGAAAVNADLLIGSGAVRTVQFSHISMGEYGFAPNFRRRFEQGAVKGLEQACPTLTYAIQAGAMGIPFIPVRGLIGTDYMEIREDIRLIPNPYDPPESIAVVPAIVPDVALFHGYAADPLGNVVAPASQNNRLLAQASRLAIASVEEIVSPERLRTIEGTWIPAPFLTAVVHIPGGAFPTGCAGHYALDGAFIEAYLQASRSEEGFREYLAHSIL